MSDDKKYYYLKLKDNFFDSDAMIVLESMKDGYVYSNILLKIYLRSMKDDGRLMFNEHIPYNSTILASVTRHSVGDVEKAIKTFKDLGLVDVLDNGAIYMLDIQNYIGKSSTEADRKREYRQRLDSEKKNLSIGAGGQMSGQTGDKNPPERELELELELKKDKDTSKPLSSKPDPIPYKEIIDYLNEKANRQFKNVEANKKLIRNRWNDKYTVDDFKRVIDTKVAEWGKTDMAKYIQPSTLFGTKFDQYLNQPTKAKRPEFAGVDYNADNQTGLDY